jgi:hypothetical protein
MRRHLRIGAAALAAALAAIGAPRLQARGEDAKAAAVMAHVRKALGGEQALTSVNALSIRAAFRRELAAGIPGGGGTFVIMSGGGAFGGGGSQVSGSIEIDVVLPDRFYRQESTSSGMQMTRIDGFDGDRPFIDMFSNSPGTRVTVDRPEDNPERAAALLKRTRSDLARLLLGLVGRTQAGMPVTYAYAGQAESPDGTADVIDVTGPDDFKVRLFVDSASRLPLMLTYSDVEPQVRTMTMRRDGPSRAAEGGAHGASRGDVTPEQQAEIEKQREQAGAAPRTMIEFRMFFSDHRETNGLMLPHRIARGTAEKTTEEWEIKDYKVNPDIKPDRFKVGTE